MEQEMPLSTWHFFFRMKYIFLFFLHSCILKKKHGDSFVVRLVCRSLCSLPRLLPRFSFLLHNTLTVFYAPWSPVLLLSLLVTQLHHIASPGSSTTFIVLQHLCDPSFLSVHPTTIKTSQLTQFLCIAFFKAVRFEIPLKHQASFQASQSITTSIQSHLYPPSPPPFPPASMSASSPHKLYPSTSPQPQRPG